MSRREAAHAEIGILGQQRGHKHRQQQKHIDRDSARMTARVKVGCHPLKAAVVIRPRIQVVAH